MATGRVLLSSTCSEEASLSLPLTSTMGSSQSTQRPAVDAHSDDEKRSLAEVAASLSSLRLESPVSADGTLALSSVSSWESESSADPKTQLARTILSHSDIRSALISRSALIADAHVFNNEVDFKTGPVTNQKSSGRCWIFAATNVMRFEIMKKLKLKEFQLSQVGSRVLTESLTAQPHPLCVLVLSVLLG